MRGALLVAGATSDAGKSVLTAGLCRRLARQGVRVAPFKAQNMSLNSFGVFAALHGIVALLEPTGQAPVAGFVINKFRGARELLEPGLRMLTDYTGRPTFGIVPWTEGLWPDMEDSLALDAGRPWPAGPPLGADVLRVSVVRLPRIGDAADLDALAAEPGVLVRPAAAPAGLADADLVVLPGTRATVSDPAWLRDQGLAEVITAHAAKGLPVLGIRGGCQMLSREIDDEVESGAGCVAGFGLLPARVAFAAEKTLGRQTGTGYGADVAGHEIRHGIVPPDPGAEPFPGGCRTGAGPPDTAALSRLIAEGPPAGLPVIPPGGGRS